MSPDATSGSSDAGIGWWHVSIGAMLFGGVGAAAFGFLLAIGMVALLLGYGLFALARMAFRAMVPRKVKSNDCPQELLDHWAEWRRRNPHKLTPLSR